MPKNYIVKEGECVHSIASREGFFWKTIWNEGGNAGLREKRKDPAVLLVGDELVIPDKRIKAVSLATGKVHEFLVKGIPVKLRLVVQHNEQPIPNEEYTLEVNDHIVKGKTNEKGLVEAYIDPLAERARLSLKGLVFELELGALDPVEEDVGIQSRLQNLGLYDGHLDGKIGPVTKAAIAEFQSSVGMKPTGELDDDTRARLLQFHREEDEFANAIERGGEEASTIDEASSGADSLSDCAGDPTDEDEEFPEYLLESISDSSD
ncbi:MAG TPA: peptidoglycan-binding domain-containing protein [Polyangiaceae bacterium]|nr:peptidoglycan-binding domain-containing protein [Polyangiaceae bacterium]